MQMDRNVYSGRLKLHGEEHEQYPLIGPQLRVDSLVISSTSMKPSRCCAKRCPRRDAFSERVI